MAVPLGILTCNGIYEACLFMHGDVADKNRLYSQNKVFLCHSLMLTMLVRYSLKLTRIDLLYDLKPQLPLRIIIFPT
jgi:hypothetical protein